MLFCHVPKRMYLQSVDIVDCARRHDIKWWLLGLQMKSYEKFK